MTILRQHLLSSATSRAGERCLSGTRNGLHCSSAGVRLALDWGVPPPRPELSVCEHQGIHLVFQMSSTSTFSDAGRDIGNPGIQLCVMIRLRLSLSDFACADSFRAALCWALGKAPSRI